MECCSLRSQIPYFKLQGCYPPTRTNLQLSVCYILLRLCKNYLRNPLALCLLFCISTMYSTTIFSALKLTGQIKSCNSDSAGYAVTVCWHYAVTPVPPLESPLNETLIYSFSLIYAEQRTSTACIHFWYPFSLLIASHKSMYSHIDRCQTWGPNKYSYYRLEWQVYPRPIFVVCWDVGTFMALVNSRQSAGRERKMWEGVWNGVFHLSRLRCGSGM